MFKIGDKLTKENYTDGAIWCNKNSCCIRSDNWQIEAIPMPTDAETITTEIAELKQKLSGTDYAVIKIAEGVATPAEYADIIAQRAVWRSRINELEAEIAR